jgi:hypothetical protein
MRSDTEPAAETDGFDASRALPTAPCSVVWSRGHAYVLERVRGRPRWLGVDDRGRREELSVADLQRRGWSRTCTRDK